MLRRILLLAAAAVATAVFVGGATGAGRAIVQPRASTAAQGARVPSLPAFGWSSVSGADHYEFELAADSGFNSPVLGSEGHFITRNTRASISKTIPNGTYWWRVRAVSGKGSVGAWSSPRRVVKAWQAAPALTGPANGSHIAYPSPLVLPWSSVPGAVEYDVRIATDPAL